MATLDGKKVSSGKDLGSKFPVPTLKRILCKAYNLNSERPLSINSVSSFCLIRAVALPHKKLFGNDTYLCSYHKVYVVCLLIKKEVSLKETSLTNKLNRFVLN